MADIYNKSTWWSAVKPDPATDAIWDSRISAEDRARARIDARFGIGVLDAHRILRENSEANRIYDCAFFALVDAEQEIEMLRKQLQR